QHTSIGEQKPQQAGPQNAGVNPQPGEPQPGEPYTAEQTPPLSAEEDYGAYGYPIYDSGYYYGGWGLGVGWAPVWWFNPFFPSVAFVHPVFFPHRAFFVHHPFVGARAVHVANVHNAFVGPHVHAFGARSVTLHHGNAFVGRNFAGGFHGTGFHGGGM